MDPWSKLIRRAQAFRDALVQASADNTASYGKSRKLTKDQDEKKNEAFPETSGLLRNLFTEESSQLADEEEEEEEEEEEGEEGGGGGDGEVLDLLLCTSLELEHPGDVAEEALLQELFFPANKEARLPSLQKKHADSLLDRNTVRLTVFVGKLLFCQPVSSPNRRLVAGIATNGLASSCLLTLIFPAITTERMEVGCSPEQCISIMPIKANGNEFFFDHQSQLVWKLPSEQLLSSIWSTQQMMKASVEVMTGVGEVLQGNAYLPLQNVVKQMSSVHRVNMVLVSSDKGSQNSSIQASKSTKPDQKRRLRSHEKKDICMMLKQDGQQPLAILEIGLRLVHGMCDTGSAVIPKNMPHATEESWLYVYIHNGLALTKVDALHGRSKSLILMIKSGNHSSLRFFFMTSSCTKTDSQPRVWAGNLADALLKSPDKTERFIVFIEIWCGHTGSSKLRSDGLENLIGLVKVPFSAVGDERKSPDKSIVDGFFSLWHPRSDAEGQKMRVTVYIGSKPEILRVLQETRSAVIIQRQSRMFLERKRKEKLKRRHFSESNGHISSQGDTLRHVFEVTVRKAKNIPVEVLSNKGNCYNCRGMFIKYIFPGEDDPLFTHDMELQEIVVFGATAHHRITLAQGQDLVDYLENLDDETNGLRFELWSDVLAKRDNTHWKLASEDLTVSEDNYKSLLREDQLNSCIKRIEKCIGTATLPMQELLGLVTLTYQNRLSLKIRKLFDLPIKFHKWVNFQATTPKLTVQVAYDMVELAEKHLLDGTVFYDHAIAAKELHFPLKARLEVIVEEVRSNQAVLNFSSPHTLTDFPSVRFSLFPCNRELESKYPPIMTTLEESSQHLRFATNIILDALIIKELWESYMTFEVWQHRTKKHEDSSSWREDTFQQDLWVGVAIAPSVMLISQKQGVAGWIDLVGINKQSVGCLKVSVKFLRWEPLLVGNVIEDV